MNKAIRVLGGAGLGMVVGAALGLTLVAGVAVGFGLWGSETRRFDRELPMTLLIVLTACAAAGGLVQAFRVLLRKDGTPEERTLARRRAVRRLTGLTIVVVGIVILATALAPGFGKVMWGYLRLEPLKDGLPRSYWVHALNHPDSYHRLHAVEALVLQGQPLEPALIQKMGETAQANPDVSWRSLSYGALSKLGTSAKPALSAIVAGMTDVDPNVRHSAGQALQKLGVEAAPAVKALVKIADQREPPIAVIAVLGQIGPEAAEVLPALNKLDLDYRRENFQAVESAFLQIDPERSKFWVAELQASSKRREALLDLVHIGTPARATAPALLPLLQDDNVLIRTMAALALWRVDGRTKETVPVLSEAALAEIGVSESYHMVKAFREMGADARAAIPTLRKGLTASKPTTRALTASLLGAIGPETAVAVPEITALLSDPDREARAAAVEALGRIGVSAKPAVPEITKLLGDVEKPVVQQAAIALFLIDGQTQPLADRLKEEYLPFGVEEAIAAGPAGIQVLIEALQTKDASRRSTIITMLGRIGPTAKPALPALWAIATEPEASYARGEARLVLEQIEPGSYYRFDLMSYLPGSLLAGVVLALAIGGGSWLIAGLRRWKSSVEKMRA